MHIFRDYLKQDHVKKYLIPSEVQAKLMGVAAKSTYDSEVVPELRDAIASSIPLKNRKCLHLLFNHWRKACAKTDPAFVTSSEICTIFEFLVKDEINGNFDNSATVLELLIFYADSMFGDLERETPLGKLMHEFIVLEERATETESGIKPDPVVVPEENIETVETQIQSPSSSDSLFVDGQSLEELQTATSLNVEEPMVEDADASGSTATVPAIEDVADSDSPHIEPTSEQISTPDPMTLEPGVEDATDAGDASTKDLDVAVNEATTEELPATISTEEEALEDKLLAEPAPCDLKDELEKSHVVKSQSSMQTMAELPGEAPVVEIAGDEELENLSLLDPVSLDTLLVSRQEDVQEEEEAEQDSYNPKSPKDKDDALIKDIPKPSLTIHQDSQHTTVGDAEASTEDERQEGERGIDYLGLSRDPSEWSLEKDVIQALGLLRQGHLKVIQRAC